MAAEEASARKRLRIWASAANPCVEKTSGRVADSSRHSPTAIVTDLLVGNQVALVKEREGERENEREREREREREKRGERERKKKESKRLSGS